MIWTKRNPRAALVAAAFAVVLLGFSQASLAAPRHTGASVSAQEGGAAASDAAAKLDKKSYRVYCICGD